MAIDGQRYKVGEGAHIVVAVKEKNRNPVSGGINTSRRFTPRQDKGYGVKLQTCIARGVTTRLKCDAKKNTLTSGYSSINHEHNQNGRTQKATNTNETPLPPLRSSPKPHSTAGYTLQELHSHVGGGGHIHSSKHGLSNLTWYVRYGCRQDRENTCEYVCSTGENKTFESNAGDKKTAVLVWEILFWNGTDKNTASTKRSLGSKGFPADTACLTDAGRRWRVGLHRRRLPLPAADVDEPGPHLGPQLLVAVVDALEILVRDAECHVTPQQTAGRGAAGQANTARSSEVEWKMGPAGAKNKEDLLGVRTTCTTSHMMRLYHTGMVEALA